ncbi:MAG: hypothetical protein V7K48_08730 [Nostoc sp.]|uniref:hypothetical protein n=1 Tax=Nostoc sp. TaxID=1180 RepID=UPI002FFCDC85
MPTAVNYAVSASDFELRAIACYIMSDLILMSLRAKRGNPKPLRLQLFSTRGCAKETLREHSTSLHKALRAWLRLAQSHIISDLPNLILHGYLVLPMSILIRTYARVMEERTTPDTEKPVRWAG